MASIEPTTALADEVAAARERVLDKLKSAAAAINAEIFRLETTSEIQLTEIERTYEALLWAVDHLAEEGEMAELEVAL